MSVIAVLAGEAGAATVSFTSHSAWQAAAGGPADITLINFGNIGSGVTQKFVNDPSISPSFSSLGVDFLDFVAKPGVFPEVLPGQAGQISDPGNVRDVLVTNTFMGPGGNSETRAIRFNFNQPERAVGLFFNVGDGGFLRAYDSALNVLGQTQVSASGGFVGLVSDTNIFRVHVVNTFNSDIRFGFWDLQFGSMQEGSAVPLPGVALGGLMLLGATVAPRLLGRKRGGAANQ